MGTTAKSGRILVLGHGSSGRAAAELAGPSRVDFAEGCDLVIASPGIRVVSELQYGCEALARLGVRLIAITGSKGKSSVVKAIADGLNRAGHSAVPCGNYGLPVTAVAKLDPLPEWAVVEVSSFQLETTWLQPGTFDFAAVLNLQEDHLDRHGSVAVYHSLKLRLLDMAKVGVNCADWSGADAAATAGMMLAGSYFDNPILRTNGAAAVRALREAGLDGDGIRAAFANFEPLPHRMNVVGVFGGVKCIDDSKATSIAALVAGVTMAGKGVRLIAGGLPKGDDPASALSVLTERVQKVYLIGRSAEAFGAAWKGAVECELCGTLEVAVSAAMREAVAGEVLLLSPGTASFDQFKSFGERGEVFARLVKKEGQAK